MGPLRCLSLLSLLLGLYNGCLGGDYSEEEEEWRTRYAPPDCEKPPPFINETGRYFGWFYNLSAAQCQGFFSPVNASGPNNFPSKEACNKICRDEHYGLCADPRNDSLCNRTREQRQLRFWFNADKKTCDMYWYGGCGGHTNSFRKKPDCLEACGEFIDDVCSLPIDRGDCFWNETRYGYNGPFKTCEAFTYTGCGGNKNNFKTAHECWITCAKDSRCLKHTQENSEWYRWFKSYYYNSVKNECRLTKTFFKKRMGPKYNRFPNITECQRVCMRKHSTRKVYFPGLQENDDGSWSKLKPRLTRNNSLASNNSLINS